MKESAAVMPSAFDPQALLDAVDAQRRARGLTWAQVTREVFPSGPWGEAQLRRIAKGGRSDVYQALAICGWLGRTIQSFMHETWF